MKIIYVSDFFVDHILGGGELNDYELLNILISQGHEIERVQSHLMSDNFIKNKNSEGYRFIISNFANLATSCLQSLIKCKYLIYEHDHKYLRSRNPANYENFIAPEQEIVNKKFYQNALAVLCQSKFHKNIVEKNLKLKNIKSLSGNLWSTDSLDVMRTISRKEKRDVCAVLNSSIEHKNTYLTTKYCESKNIKFELIASQNYYEFLSLLGTCNKFIFFPKTPETLSRVIVEARMMGLSIISNKNISATKEDWYSLKGHDLIDRVLLMRNQIPKVVIESLEQ